MPLPIPPFPTRQSALFLDLDGTLLEFAQTPLGVIVPWSLRETLIALQDALGGAIAILSGRPIPEIDALLEIPQIAAAGIHGTDWRQSAAADTTLRPNTAELDPVRTHLQRISARIPGLLVEDKGSALAIHFRQCASAADEVKELADKLLRIAGSGYALQHGNHVVELKPAGADKGSAMHRFMQTEPFLGRRPWMIGDDLTDEPAFARANDNDGISVIVGARRPTQAMHALENPLAVHAWLDRARSRIES